jgi:hypothetical protein
MMGLIERCPQCAAMHERMKFAEDELREATMHEAACGRELAQAHAQLRGAVEALRELLDAGEAAHSLAFGTTAKADRWRAAKTAAHAVVGGQSDLAVPTEFPKVNEK